MGRLITLCSVLVLISSVTHAQDKPYSNRHTDFKPVPPRPFSFEQLLKLLAAPETTSVDVLVEKLPQAYHENYVEIFASRSPEKEVSCFSRNGKDGPLE